MELVSTTPWLVQRIVEDMELCVNAPCISSMCAATILLHPCDCHDANSSEWNSQMW
jgi:hypothetical protein